VIEDLRKIIDNKKAQEKIISILEIILKKGEEV